MNGVAQIYPKCTKAINNYFSSSWSNWTRKEIYSVDKTKANKRVSKIQLIRQMNILYSLKVNY